MSVSANRYLNSNESDALTLESKSERDGYHKTICSANAGYQSKVNEIHPEYCALPEKDRKGKRIFFLKERILECDDMKGKSFVQHDDYEHNDSGNKLHKFYLINLENKKAKAYVLSKIAQSCRDVTKLEKLSILNCEKKDSHLLVISILLIIHISYFCT